MFSLDAGETSLYLCRRCLESPYQKSQACCHHRAEARWPARSSTVESSWPCKTESGSSSTCGNEVRSRTINLAIHMIHAEDDRSHRGYTHQKSFEVHQRPNYIFSRCTLSPLKAACRLLSFARLSACTESIALCCLRHRRAKYDFASR